MTILIIGLGTIGTTYAYLFKKSGYEVEHYIRKDSPKSSIKEVQVSLLDGRKNKQGEESHDIYKVKKQSATRYDFIFISVPSGEIEQVIETLDEEGIFGTLVLACGIWEDRSYLDRLLQGRDYILAYPVAGGNMLDHRLNCCVFDHFMLEKEVNTAIPNYQELVQLFTDCQIRLEQPYDMLEWIWLHMGINAGVISVIGRHRESGDTTAVSAERLMTSSQYLKEAVQTIRETTKITAARGVRLGDYRSEFFAYQLPTFISVPLMKRLFAKNRLTRQIMTLHSNLNDLFFVCNSFYDYGKADQVAAPVFYKAYEEALKKR
ncbi:ketopantoate reductase family protein [Streptococcus ferus]|uniref:Ketopantoate reductase ApbA/PanE domain-containing protein n=1 Tax=Streptococcus ferus TaxID=1345 RepID=A0A2X3VL73_9STRE|nr:2-dehydropantoate 2-reductase N-terminal domain-containing protein [Streptococcus ferus]SQF40178.1 ketopantoate reductase ApbA/PanE domain-containing protein [Streptococcus ferus]